MKICPKCSAEYGILADYCGECGTRLPRKKLSIKLRKQKTEHDAVICKNGERHAVQAATGKKTYFCITCGERISDRLSI